MYQVGELIVYGGEGVCRVQAIGASPVAGADPEKLYYTLSPVYHEGIIFAPVDINVPMRRVLSGQQARLLLQQIPYMETPEPVARDVKAAEQQYKALLQTYSYENLLALIRLIYTKNEAAIHQGKNYSNIDQRFLKRAKTLLYEELSTALDIPIEQVEETIIREAETV